MPNHRHRPVPWSQIGGGLRISLALVTLLQMGMTVRTRGGDPVPAELPSRRSQESVPAQPKPGDADFPLPTPSNRHTEKVAAVKSGRYELVLIGDSITQTVGEGGEEWASMKPVWEKHFAPRQAINLGYSGYRTENILWNLENGELEFNPSPKVMMLLIGTNNTDDQHYPKVHSAEQVFAGTKAIVERIRHRHPTTRILILRIFPCGGPGDRTEFHRKYNRSAGAMASVRRAGELTAKLADGVNVFWLDIGQVFLRPDGSINTDLMPDLIHPNAAGAEVWAQAVEPTLARLMGDQPIPGAGNGAVIVREPEATKPLSWPGETIDSWRGYRRHVFKVEGCEAWVVEPKRPAAGNPWTWCLEFPDAFTERTGVPQLLEQGFYHLHIQVGNTYGCPAALRHFDAFYQAIVARGLAKQGTLIGVSRGGLYAYNWAAQNPGKVLSIYGDAPVCDFKSWPGGKGRGKGSPADWASLLKNYGFRDEAEALAYTGNPVDALAPLAKAGIQLIHVVGDADDVVPVAENTQILEERYKSLGGRIVVIHKAGGGHHPHGLDDPTPVVRLIQAQAGQALIQPQTPPGAKP